MSTCLPLLEDLCHQRGEVGGAAGVTPFIVVPGDDLGERVLFLAEDQRERQVNRGGVRIALVVDADERLIHGLQDALEARLLGGIAEAWRSSSVVVAFSNSTVRSMTETVEVGTRNE